MSVLLETSLGDLVIDLDTEACPQACTNFLKLAKVHYYTHNVFFSVQKDFLAQTGDPTGTGKGGSSIWSRLPSSSPEYKPSPFFKPERNAKHDALGVVSMACVRRGEHLVAGSQFFVTLGTESTYLDEQHAPFGYVVEGAEEGGTLSKINRVFVDQNKRPLQDVLIRHVEVLDDPFDDPEGLVVPSRPPSPIVEEGPIRLGADETLEDTRTAEEKEAAQRASDANAAALTLEIVGDLPFAEVRPPENILFVCKLNPVTRGEDLELLFSRFGTIRSCEVIRDAKTGDSLQYAFIEFDQRESAETAYLKMQNVLVDDRRIWVDFSQSVSGLHDRWLQGKKRRAGPNAELRVQAGRGAGSSSAGRGPHRDYRVSRGSRDRSRSPSSRRYNNERRDRSRYDERRYDERGSYSHSSRRSHRSRYEDDRQSSRRRDEEDDHRRSSRAGSHSKHDGHYRTRDERGHRSSRSQRDDGDTGLRRHDDRSSHHRSR